MCASPKIQKTNAARLLDRARIAYELVPYKFDPEDLAAQHVAEELGEPIEQVYKTLVLHGDRTGHFVCVLAGNREVDLKKAAKASGNKKAEMIHVKELLPLTGYIRGGCTAIGMKKPFPVFLQQDVAAFDIFYVSAGQRGLQLKLSPKDYISYTGATLCDIAADEPQSETEQ